MAAQNEQSIWDFLIPDIGRLKQSKAFQGAVSRASENLGQDFDNRGQPVEGPQQPGMIQPTAENMGQLSMIDSQLNSGNRKLQQTGMETMSGLVNTQAQQDAIRNAIASGKGLDEQLNNIMSADPSKAPQYMAQKRLAAADGDKLPAGMAGQFKWARKNGQIPESMKYEEFVKLIKKSEAQGSASGNPNGKEAQINRLMELKFSRDEAIKHIDKAIDTTKTFMGDTIIYEHLPGGGVKVIGGIDSMGKKMDIAQAKAKAAADPSAKTGGGGIKELFGNMFSSGGGGSGGNKPIKFGDLPEK